MELHFATCIDSHKAIMSKFDVVLGVRVVPVTGKFKAGFNATAY